MSYSFNVRGASAAAVLAAAAVKLDEVVAAQPLHAVDRDHAEKVVADFLPLIGEPGENQDLSVSVNGTVSKYESDTVTSVGIGVNISILTRAD